MPLPTPKRTPPKAKPVEWQPPGVMAGKRLGTVELRYDGPKPVMKRLEATTQSERIQGGLKEGKPKPQTPEEARLHELFNRRFADRRKK